MPEELYKKIFAKNLNYYMKLNNKTQADIINDLGFNKSAVSTWCNGTRLPRMDKVDTLAKYFKINRSDLIEEKSDLENRDGYYLDDETARAAQEMYEDPDMRSLFDMKRNMPADRFAAHVNFMKELYEKENPSD